MQFEVATLSVNNKGKKDKLYLPKVTVKKALFLLGNTKYVTEISLYERRNKCRKFTRSNIHNIVYRDRNRLYDEDWNEFAFAIVGSDQVWHGWNRIENELSYFYLDFIETSKRIAYAPSFGFTMFPEKDIIIHKKGLLEMASLSCRENEGCDLIYHLTGRKSEKVLDPTLLLEPEDWINLEKRPAFLSEKEYLLQFVLGECINSYQEEITAIAKERNLPIVDINNRRDPLKYGISPSEFIWLVRHAKVICTDSFHAAVFSILFERHLRVFERSEPRYGNMFGRLVNLLEPFELMNNIYGIGSNYSTKLSERAARVLLLEKRKSIDYLQKSLSQK